LVASPASALAPNVGGALVSLELFPVEVSGADTFFPHVSGDLVSYESGGSKVAYYDVRTGATVVVRDDSGGDFGNDVNDGRVLYGWLASGGASVYLFDTGTSTTTEVDPQPAPYRFLPALGGNTVAFTQVVGEQEAMFVGFLGGPTIQIPNDARFNEIAQVAPHGGLVVWARCG